MLIPNWLSNFYKALLIIALIFFSSCDFISSKILTKPIVQVENYSLSAQDFSKELAIKLKDLDALSAKDPKILSVFKDQIINDFVISTFVTLWFKENSLTLSPAEIDVEVKSMLSAYPTDALFRELLSEARLSYSEWLQKVEAVLMKKRLLVALAKDAPKISDEELLSYYNSNRSRYEQPEAVLLAHILVNDDGEAEIVKNLLRKQPFTEVAKKYSSAYNPESKDVYGWIERGYAPELEKSFKQGIGETLGPVKLSDGIHIFRLMEKKPFKIRTFAELTEMTKPQKDKIRTFAEAQNQITSEVRALRETARFTSWLDVQIKKYRVKKNLNMLDSIRVETR